MLRVLKTIRNLELIKNRVWKRLSNQKKIPSIILRYRIRAKFKTSRITGQYVNMYFTHFLYNIRIINFSQKRTELRLLTFYCFMKFYCDDCVKYNIFINFWQVQNIWERRRGGWSASNLRAEISANLWRESRLLLKLSRACNS